MGKLVSSSSIKMVVSSETRAGILEQVLKQNVLIAKIDLECTCIILIQFKRNIADCQLVDDNDDYVIKWLVGKIVTCYTQ